MKILYHKYIPIIYTGCGVIEERLECHFEGRLFMLLYVGTYLFIMTAAGFSICAYDKRMAMKKLPRVSEASLCAVAVLGGSLGVFAAMLIKKHKTQKPKFAAGISFIMILQAVLILYLLKVF